MGIRPMDQQRTTSKHGMHRMYAWNDLGTPTSIRYARRNVARQMEKRNHLSILRCEIEVYCGRADVYGGVQPLFF